MSEFDIYAFFSRLTVPSPYLLSHREVDGKPFTCVYEVEFPGSGFVCLAQAVAILGVLRHYEPCRMSAKGECPIKGHKKTPLPVP